MLNRLFGVRSGDPVDNPADVRCHDGHGNEIHLTEAALARAGLVWEGNILTGYYLADRRS